MRHELEQSWQWLLRNWVPASALFIVAIQASLAIPLTFKTAKNVEAIAKCLIRVQVLDPNDVELSQNKQQQQ